MCWPSPLPPPLQPLQRDSPGIVSAESDMAGGKGWGLGHTDEQACSLEGCPAYLPQEDLTCYVNTRDLSQLRGFTRDLIAALEWAGSLRSDGPLQVVASCFLKLGEGDLICQGGPQLQRGRRHRECVCVCCAGLAGSRGRGAVRRNKTESGRKNLFWKFLCTVTYAPLLSL